MPKYVDKLLHKYQHKKPAKPQLSPHEASPYIPMKKEERQYAPTADTSETLSKQDTLIVQSIVGTLLYYGQAINNTILTALNSISAEQAKPTKQTMKKSRCLLDYVATFPDVFICFHASNMILTSDSDSA